MKKVGKTTRPFRYDLTQIPYDYTVEVRYRFKGLDLIDRVPDELWTEVRNILPKCMLKAEEPDIKLPTSAGSSKKQESTRKAYISALLTMPKPLTVWITINCGKF